MPSPGCITIGNFDGVHLGHQSLIGLASQTARELNLALGIITFWPHPAAIIKGAPTHMALSDRQERLRRLKELGAETIIELPFTPELASFSPEDFVIRHLLPISVRELVIGHDFTLGKNRSGDFECLAGLGKKYGFNIRQAPPFCINGQPVSSTALRRAIASGHMQEATAMLGRPYAIEGSVGHGYARGRNLGFPTANVIGYQTLLPKNGVYAAKAYLNGRKYPAVTNIGYNPTFGNDAISVEAHLLESCPDLYGLPVRLEFIQKLRDEHKFDSVAALKEQIEKDTGSARQILLGSDDQPSLP